MKRTVGIVVVFLLVCAGIVFLLLPSGEREVSDKPAGPRLTVDSGAVVRITLQRPAQTITLENVGGRWTITAPARYNADAVVVTQLIGALSRLQLGSVISSNPEKQRLFQVDSTGTIVSLTDRAGSSVSFIVGKMGPSFTEVFLRFPNTNQVYLAQGIDSWSLNRELKDWRDKTILSAPSEGVKGLVYTTGGREYQFRRDSTGWKAGNETVQQDEINPPLNVIASLRADDFADGLPAGSAPVTIRIDGPEQTMLTMAPRLPDSSRFYLQASSNPQTFLISKWTALQLLRPVLKPAGLIASRPAPQQKPAVIASTPSPKAMPKASPKATQKMPPPPVKAVPPPKREITGTQQEPAPAVQKPAEQPKTENGLPRFVTKKPKSKKEKAPVTEAPVQQPAAQKAAEEKKPVTVPPVEKKTETVPAAKPAEPPAKNPPPASGNDTDGDLTVYTVQRGETMQSIARKNNVTVEQILKWNLLKSIVVRPGQELYIYVKK